MNNTINLIYANASGELSPHIATIESATSNAVTACSKVINNSNVDIIVINDSSNTIPEVGVGGYTPNRHLSYLYIDTHKTIKEDEVYNTICHELHHARRYDGPGFGTTLIDSMIFEGLACCFEQELQIKESYFLRTVYNFNNVQKLISEQKDYLSNSKFNYKEWFITGNKKLPRWAGYIMGYHIVKEYLKKTNKKASELVLEDPSVFYNSYFTTDKN